MDVVAITGLLVKGEELLALYSLLARDLGIQFSKSKASNSTFLAVNVKSKGLVFDGEHHAFLLYWLYKYFICINFVAIVSEYSYYVTVIVFGRPLALAFLFLSLLYRGFFAIIKLLKLDEDIKNVPRPLWFLPLWIY